MLFGEPHPFPRGSPTRLSTSGRQSYEGLACRDLHEDCDKGKMWKKMGVTTNSFLEK